MVNDAYFLRILEEGARAGGKVLKSYFQKNVKIETKESIQDTVSVADYASQKAIVQIVEDMTMKTEIAGKVGYLGEEGLYKKGEYTFVIDPLDGTNNFLSGLDYFNVTIGILHKEKPIAGVVYHVMRDIMYGAASGKGAHVNKKPLKIPTDRKFQAVSAVTYLSDRAVRRKKTLREIDKIHAQIRNVRLNGAIALDICAVAAGYADIAWGGGSAWDLAGASLVVREAGGVVLDEASRPLILKPENKAAYYRFFTGEEKLVHTFQHNIKDL